MTLLELIRNLHLEGKPVLDYDLYISDNSALDMEDVVRREPGYESAEPMISPSIPPQYLELGEKPRFLYVESLSDYKNLTRAADRLPKRFPRLLVGVFTDRSGGFLPRYKGKNWKEIPPLEISMLTRDGLVLPALDAAGNLTGLIYDGETAIDTPATYYTLISPYGSEFAWQGDLTHSPLPEGLRLLSKNF